MFPNRVEGHPLSGVGDVRIKFMASLQHGLRRVCQQSVPGSDLLLMANDALCLAGKHSCLVSVNRDHRSILVCKLRCHNDPSEYRA